MLTILEGNQFLVADDLGNVGEGVEGLYSADTRHLSRWRILLDGRLPKLLSPGQGLRDGRVYAQHESGRVAALAAGRDPRAVRLGGLVAGAAGAREPRDGAPVVVRYEFDADFLDLFEVKSQTFGERDLAFAKTITPLRRRVASTRARDRSSSSRRRGLRGSSLVWFSKRASPAIAAATSRSAPAAVRVVARRRVMPRSPRGRPTAAGRVLPAARRMRVRDSQRGSASRPDARVERARPHRTSTASRWSTSTRCECAHDAARPTSELPAAGLPWFMAPFGRDTLISSFQAIPSATASPGPRCTRSATSRRAATAPSATPSRARSCTRSATARSPR